MKIIITGANGMLGKDLTDDLLDTAGYEVLPFGREGLDVTNFNSVRDIVFNNKPDVVVHLAALTDVDGCEDDFHRAYVTNYLGTWYVSQACSENNAVLIYLSTDMVFDGQKGDYYIETDRPSPLNNYGKTKLAGEQLVQRMVFRHYIIRSGWMFGGGERDKKFVGKVIQKVLSGESLQVVMDRIGSPTYTKDLSRGIICLLNGTYPWGLYHIANEGMCSRYEFAAKIVSILEEPNLLVNPVSSSCFPSAAPRPVLSALNNYALKLMNGFKMRPWNEALKEYIEQHYKV